MNGEVILPGLVSGLLMGFVYALIAAGLSLIFGLMEIVNFAHGEFLMLAMFATFWAWALARLDPLTSLPITVALLFLLGFAVHSGLIPLDRRAHARPDLATFGLAIFLRAAAQALWGVDFSSRKARRGWTARPWAASSSAAPARGACERALSPSAFLLVHHAHGNGLALRATARTGRPPPLMGIDTQRMFALGWGIGAACVGAAERSSPCSSTSSPTWARPSPSAYVTWPSAASACAGHPGRGGGGGRGSRCSPVS